jgi:hypothetical protein
MQRDRYPKINIPSIANITSLASLLSISEADLFYIADNVQSLYKPGKNLTKKSGELRATHDAKPAL